MPRAPDLTGFTIMLIIATACLIPLIRFSDKRKRIAIRCLIILLAATIYLSVVIPEIKTIPSTEDSIVYITDTGEKYHSADCRHLWNSKIPMTLEEAISAGYDDCLHCATPTYRTEDIQITFIDLYPRKTLTIAGFAILGIVVYFGLHFLLGWLFEYRKERQRMQRLKLTSSKNIASPIQAPSPIAPVCENSPERQICEALWRSVAFFRNRTGMPPDITADTYLWAALFYVVAKQIRNQETVDKIYSHFGLAARLELQHYDVPCGTPLVREMRECYTKTAKALNASGIDPRTDDGISQLWELLYRWMTTNHCPFPDDPSTFRSTVILTRAFVSSQKQNHGCIDHRCHYSISSNESNPPTLPT